MDREQEEVLDRQEHIVKAIPNPAASFRRPMDVIAAVDIATMEKLAILKAWEADEQALQRGESEGMGGGEHAHLHRFLFVPANKVLEVAKLEGATPYDVPGVEFGHHGKECSFDALVKKHQLDRDPAIVLLGKIVNGADTDNTLWNQPESAGLNAIAEGFRHLGLKDDHEILAAESIVYDALYAYCQEMVRRGRSDGQFR